MFRASLCLLLLLQPPPGGKAAKSGWIEYRPEDGSCTIALPNKPTESTTERNGITARIIFAENAAANDAVFALIIQDLRRSIASEKSAKDFLDGAEEGFVGKSGGKIVHRADISLGNLAGREILLDNFQGLKLRCRVYVGGKRSYQAMVMAENEPALHANAATQFFNSFQVHAASAPLTRTDRSDDPDFKLGRAVGGLCVEVLVVGLVVTGVIILTVRQRRRARTRRRQDRFDPNIESNPHA